MSGKSNNSLQILVDSFDDIPNIMTKMNESINNSPTRYKATGRNSSFAVDGVMRGNKRVDVSKRENTHRVERMATQAMRVLDNLSKLPNQKKPARSITETSAIAQSKLKSLVDSGIDIQKFYQQYDVNRSGKVSYKDFCDTLGAVSSGIGREEAHELARQLDGRRVGLIEYGNIIDSLQRIHREAAYRDGAPSSQQHHQPQPSSANRRDAPPLPLPQQAWQEVAQELQQHQQAHNQQQQQATQDTHSASSESKSEPQNSSSPSYNTNTNIPNNSNNNNTTSQKVAPRTSFAPVPPSLDTSSSTVFSPTSPADLPSPALHSRPATPESEARMLVARRFFHNPEVNHVMYGEAARVTPFDFDRHHLRNESAHPHREHRRRCASAPTRARRSSFADSGCNVVPTAEPVRFDELAHYSTSLRAMTDSLKFSDGGLTTAQDTALEADLALKAKFEANPFYLARERSAQLSQAAAEHAAKTVENAIVDQLGGGVANLRHTLKSFDASASGTLNSDELRGALKKSGVRLSNEQYNNLYNDLAAHATTSNTPGYSRGAVVSIDALTERLQAYTQATASAPPSSTFQATYAKSKLSGEAATQADKVRIMKKVLQSASKLTNPHAIYKHIDPQHNGFLSQPQLQDALLHMGANLSHNEFNTLVKQVPRDSEGRIEITAFERNLRDQVSAQEKHSAQQNGDIKHHFRRYSNTFATSEAFSLAHENHEFEPLCHTQGLIKPVESDKRWTQLKEVFQANPEVVRSAFAVPRPESPTRKSLRALPPYLQNSLHPQAVQVERDYTRSLSVNELKTRLAQSGLPLSADDVNKIERGLRRAATTTSSSNNGTSSSISINGGSDSGGDGVSLEKFCEVVGIEVNKRDQQKIALEDRARNLDGGVFAESLNSVHGNNNFATSFFLHSTATTDALPVTGDRRRRAPSASRGNASDPSQFWDTGNNSAGGGGQESSGRLSQLFPSPMPTFRSAHVHDAAHPSATSSSSLLDPSSAQRGVVRLNPSAQLNQVYGSVEHAAYLQNQGKGQAGQDHRGRASSITGAAVTARRSLSAPPRTLLGHPSGSVRNGSTLMRDVMTGHSSVYGSGGNGYTGTDTHRGGDNFSVHSTTTTERSAGDSQYRRLSMADKIARWAPGLSASVANNGTSGGIGGSSNASNAGGGTGNGNSGGDAVVGAPRSRSSLRRQFLQANQSSYMHGASVTAAADNTSLRSGSSGRGSVNSVSGNAPFATYASYE